MPSRRIPLVGGEIYHIFNRGIDKKPTFKDKREYNRSLLVLNFYRFVSPPIRLSRFLYLAKEQQRNILENLTAKEEKLINILAFCIMPNHYHFLLKQLNENGISKFIGQFENSYTRYFNIKNEKEGPLFLDQFKAVRIESDEQLMHVSRYIHLNPHTSFVVKKVSDLENYSWSSFPEYLNNSSGGVCEKETILSLFKNKEKYKKFVFDQANYQRELDKIKHLVLED